MAIITSGLYDPYAMKGIRSVFSANLNNEIQDNLIEWLDWTLLQKGNYFNIDVGETAPNGQDMSRMRLSSDERYTSGQVWEGFRGNWVWQSGVSHSPSPYVGSSNTAPGISGVFVNGGFHSSTTAGTYAHHIDYYNGKVIFDTALPTGSVVQVAHSHKWINVDYASAVPWLRDIQYRSYDVNSEFLQAGKGSWDELPEQRIQLPLVAVEVVPRRVFKGYQLGGGQKVYTDVLFHCIAEDSITRNNLLDMVSMQNDKTIYKYNSNSVAGSGEFPIDFRGSPVSGALRYPDLVNKHFGGRVRLQNASVQGIDMINTNLYGGIVKLTTEVIRTSI
tara:strand:+ start:2272 stop:3267 length:996 start_codon:yes stop_codon:yes gene_type:complete